MSLGRVLPSYPVDILRFPTFCSAHRSPRISENACLKYPTLCLAHKKTTTYERHLLRFSKLCSAHRSPRIPENALVDMSEVRPLATTSPTMFHSRTQHNMRLPFTDSPDKPAPPPTTTPHLHRLSRQARLRPPCNTPT